MARLTFPSSSGDPNVRYRFDTASGSTTPADLVTARSSAAIDGSVIRADVDGGLPAFRGPDGVGVLYRKKLSYADTVLETVTVRAGQSPGETAAGTAAAGAGPLVGSTAWLKLWGAIPDALLFGAIPAKTVAATSTAYWPDGTTGTFTVLAINTAGTTVDSYSVTYPGATSKLITQPTVTRDSEDNVTTRPELTVT